MPKDIMARSQAEESLRGRQDKVDRILLIGVFLCDQQTFFLIPVEVLVGKILDFKTFDLRLRTGAAKISLVG
jgi:hypothetical protein